jgi:hypothetical protein
MATHVEFARFMVRVTGTHENGVWHEAHMTFKPSAQTAVAGNRVISSGFEQAPPAEDSIRHNMGLLT